MLLFLTMICVRKKPGPTKLDQTYQIFFLQRILKITFSRFLKNLINSLLKTFFLGRYQGQQRKHQFMQFLKAGKCSQSSLNSFERNKKQKTTQHSLQRDFVAYRGNKFIQKCAALNKVQVNIGQQITERENLECYSHKVYIKRT